MNSAGNLIYRMAAPVLRWWLNGKLVHKPLADSSMHLYYRAGEHLGFLFMRCIRYEPEIMRTVLGYIKPGHLVFEIGSNIGQYSLLFSQNVGLTGKVICIEPDSDNYSLLTLNISKNNIQNAVALQVAVGEKADRLAFYKDTITGGRTSSLYKEFVGDHFEGKTETVDVISFADLVHRYGTPDFVKVDVEGAELAIFEKADKLPAQTIFFIEVREQTAKAMFDIFSSRGFRVFSLGNKMKPVAEHDKMGFDNWIIRMDNELRTQP